MEYQITVHKILREGITRHNPYIFEMPVAGWHMTVFNAIVNTCIAMGQVFAGSVNQFVQMGVDNGLDERYLKQGFTDLERYGFIKIAGDVFTPTDLFVKRFR